MGDARGSPLLVVEGSLLQQVLQRGDGVAGAEEQDAEDGDVQSQQAQEAALLVCKPCAGELVHSQCQDVADHGCAAVELLGLQRGGKAAVFRVFHLSFYFWLCTATS